MTTVEIETWLRATCRSRVVLDMSGFAREQGDLRSRYARHRRETGFGVRVLYHLWLSLKLQSGNASAMSAR